MTFVEFRKALSEGSWAICPWTSARVAGGGGDGGGGVGGGEGGGVRGGGGGGV